MVNRTDRVFVSREKEKGMTLREPIKERVFKEKEYEIIICHGYTYFTDEGIRMFRNEKKYIASFVSQSLVQP